VSTPEDVKARVAHAYNHAVADVLELDFEREPFDVAVCVFGIFFFPDMAAALAKIASFVRPGGRLAVTTWGAGLFEPVNSLFWEAIGRIRPELHKVFNPWDRLGERKLVLDATDQATVRSIWSDATPGAAKQYGDLFTSTAFLKTLGGAVLGGILGLFLGSKMGGKKPKDGKK